MTARLKSHTDSTTVLKVLPDGRLASGSADDTIRLWDPSSGAETAQPERHGGRVEALPVDIEARTLESTRNAPPDLLPSMAGDLLRGSRLELPWLGGKVVALSRELGVPTPVHATMYAALKPYANGALP